MSNFNSINHHTQWFQIIISAVCRSDQAKFVILLAYSLISHFQIKIINYEMMWKYCLRRFKVDVFLFIYKNVLQYNGSNRRQSVSKAIILSLTVLRLFQHLVYIHDAYVIHNDGNALSIVLHLWTSGWLQHVFGMPLILHNGKNTRLLNKEPLHFFTTLTIYLNFTIF